MNNKFYLKVGGTPILSSQENIFFSFHKGEPNLNKIGKLNASKRLSNFQWHGVAELPQDILSNEVFYFSNRKPTTKTPFRKEPIRTLWDQKIFFKTKYPKGTMLWGDTIDQVDPHIIAIPLNEDITYKMCIDVLNNIDRFMGYNPNHWDYRESMIERGKWSKWYETELAYYLFPEYNEKRNSIPKEEFNSFEKKLLEEFYSFQKASVAQSVE